MPKGQAHRLLSYLQRLVEPLSQEQASDGALLERFTREGDEQAFQMVLERHGPMVLATCQRILHDVHEAEDSFQATFIVLVRKARSIRKHQSLGSWLYRVAYHIALHARARGLKQREREHEVANMHRMGDAGGKPCPELRRILDEELQQLPEKYRAPLVLCYLEGKTHQQVAQELSWPTGTMSRRLARGQELLRQRLARRGLTLSALAVGQALAAEEACAVVPSALLEATTRAVVLTTWGAGAGAGLGGAKVASLASEALRGMALAKLKTIVCLALALGLAAVNAVLFWPRTEAPVSVAKVAANPPSEQAPLPVEPVHDWGEPVHGLRLRCSCDRPDYRVDRDLIRVTFALHNVSAELQPVTLLREDQEFTDLRITDAEGREYFVPGTRAPLPKPGRWGGRLPPDSIHRVSTIFDPSQVAGGLHPGRYRLRGLFRRQPSGEAPLPLNDLRLESNETSFSLKEADVATAEAGQTGLEAGGCALSLFTQRTTWKPGDPPLAFAVVLQRVADDLRPLRFLEANRLGMYYHLEITAPDGHQRLALQLPLSAGVDPLIDPFAHARLMFLQLERIPIGKSLGEGITWDPSGAGEQRYRLEPVLRTAAWATGRHTVRAVYQLRDRDQMLFGDDPAVIRLVSNPVEVWIGK